MFVVRTPARRFVRKCSTAAAAVDRTFAIASRKPSRVEAKLGETFSWCTCGFSSNQPFCDGAHRNVNIQNQDTPGFEEWKPLRFDAEKTEMYLCNCKLTKKGPFCDGTHNGIEDQSIPFRLTEEWLPYDLISTETYSSDTKRMHFKVACDDTLRKLNEIVHSDEGRDGKAAFHFTLKMPLPNGKVKTRPYTPVEFNPKSGTLEFLIKSYDDGRVSPLIGEMSDGARIEMRGPLPGKVAYETNKYRSMALFAAGTGITPILQMARAMTSDTENEGECRIYCANKTKDDILCVDELLDLALESPECVKDIWHVLEEGAENAITGRISADVLRETELPTPDSDADVAIVCGPPLFNRAMIGILEEHGYAPNQIHVF